LRGKTQSIGRSRLRGKPSGRKGPEGNLKKKKTIETWKNTLRKGTRKSGQWRRRRRFEKAVTVREIHDEKKKTLRKKGGMREVDFQDVG